MRFEFILYQTTFQSTDSFPRLYEKSGAYDLKHAVEHVLWKAGYKLISMHLVNTCQSTVKSITKGIGQKDKTRNNIHRSLTEI